MPQQMAPNQGSSNVAIACCFWQFPALGGICLRTNIQNKTNNTYSESNSLQINALLATACHQWGLNAQPCRGWGRSAVAGAQSGLPVPPLGRHEGSVPSMGPLTHRAKSQVPLMGLEGGGRSSAAWFSSRCGANDGSVILVRAAPGARTDCGSPGKRC